MPSARDIAASLLRQYIPTLMAVSGLQYRAITSAPNGDTSARTYGAWTAVVGQLEEKAQTQTRQDERGMWVKRRVAHMTVSDALALAEGSQVAINGVQPIWNLSAEIEPHLTMPGLIRYALVRDEPLYGDANRGGGR